MPYQKQNSKIERRCLPIIELRAVTSEKDGLKKIVGHAAVFNREADLGWYVEKISPGAFTQTIAEDDVRALWNHDANYLLGRNKANTLILREDDTGLYFEISTPDTQFARDLLVSVDRGDISQASFGFEVQKQSWEWVDDSRKGKDIRTLERVKLWDVSPVTFPAYQDTDVALRSHGEWKRLTSPANYREFLTRKLNFVEKFGFRS